MNNLMQFSVTAPAETALKKLKKAQIPIYNCKKSNSFFLFYAHNKYVKKVFAIFAHPCYNISVVKLDSKNGFLRFVKNRFGFIIGAVVFVALCALSNSFVLKINVSGNGSYLKSEVTQILNAQGVKQYGYISNLNQNSLASSILALPNVTFCSVEKKGAILNVYVNVNQQNGLSQSNSLKSNVNGKIIKIIALCGTPLKAEGDIVCVGDELIGAYIINGEQKISCIAAGYAKIECNASVTYYATEKSQAEEQNALRAASLYADEITQSKTSVKNSGEGYVYTVSFTYVKTLTINLNEG